MRNCWLLYDEADYAVNHDFAALMQREGEPRRLLIEPVLTNQLALAVDTAGKSICMRNGVFARPDMVLSRQRNHLISRHFERMGVPVYNNARVCELCNDKFATNAFLSGIPMPETRLISIRQQASTDASRYPLVIKPAHGHGGDRVTLVNNPEQWLEAAERIWPEPAIEQTVVSDAGRDLRVYVVFGQIVAGVLRTAKEGIVSNFKQGGNVALHELSHDERELAQRIIRRFEDAGAPLCMAGVDLLYHHGKPVLGEVEDVVGSRMLYQTSDIDIVSLFLDALCKDMAQRQS